MKKLTRKLLVDTLKDLVSDEYDSDELVYLTEEQLIEAIIYSAQWYKNEYNNIDN